MSWSPISLTVPQYVDSNGTPYSGAVLKAYAAGTSTPISMATDSTGGPTATSVALNASGYPAVSGNVVIPHVSAAYKLALYPTQAAADANSGAIWSIDTLDPLATLLAASGGSTLVGFIQSGTGAVARTGQSKLREFVSITDFGCSPSETSVNNKTYIDACFAHAKATGKDVFIPAGTFTIRGFMPTQQGTGTITVVEDWGGMTVFGTGKNSKIVTEGFGAGVTSYDVFQFNGVSNLTIRDLSVHATIDAAATNGANAFSFTGGSHDIEIRNCHAFAMPYIRQVTPDGGSFISIQQATGLPIYNIRAINNTADGGAMGFTYQASGAVITSDPSYGIVWRGNKLKNFFTGIYIHVLTGSAEVEIPKQEFLAVDNEFIDCQRDWFISGVSGLTLSGNKIRCTLTSAVDPATGLSWSSTDTTLRAIYALSNFRMNVVGNTVYKASCINYVVVGGGAQALANTPSNRCNWIGNQFYGAASDMGLWIDKLATGRGQITNSNFIGNSFTGHTGAALDPQLFYAGLNNNIIDPDGGVIRSTAVNATASPNFAVDGGFDIASSVPAPALPWVCMQTYYEVTGGMGVATAASTSTNSLYQLVNLVAGRAYLLTVTVSGYAAGTGGFYIAGPVATYTDVQTLGAQFTADATYTRIFIPVSTGSYRVGICGSASNYTANHDGFSIQEVPLQGAAGGLILADTARIVVPTYANNAAAKAAGAMVGSLYRVNAATDPEPLYIVHA